MTCVNTLAAAIEDLYRVFDVPKPATVDYCGHCVDGAKATKLIAVDRRELTADDVAVYYLNSTLIGDDHYQFRRYLLPRLLELVAMDEPEDFRGEYFLELAVTGAEIGVWTDAEQRAVRVYVVALWRHSLTNPLKQRDLFTHVCELHEDVGPFLAELERPEAAAALAELVESAMANGEDPRLNDWLKGPGPLAALERAALGDDPDGTYSNLHLALEWWRG